MEFRDARVDDAEALATVAAASLRESYGHFVGDDRIDALADRWYDPDRVADELDDETADWIVAEDDDAVVAFAQAALLDTDPIVGEIHWLHVAPDARGQGLARQLLGQVQERLEKGGAVVLRGLVLADNEDGTAFYEAHGFDRVDERAVTLDDETYGELAYEKPVDPAEAAAADPAERAVVERIDGPEGVDALFVNYSEGERGAKAPFYPTYRSRDLADRYGWYCSNCGSVSTAMDSMGRIACNDCGNSRKATRWDASYL